MNVLPDVDVRRIENGWMVFWYASKPHFERQAIFCASVEQVQAAVANAIADVDQELAERKAGR